MEEYSIGGNQYSIDDLCKRFNITKRTIYYYMSIGLLPPAGKRGRGNQYGEEFARQLEHILQFRGKMKLSHIPHTDQMNFSFRSINEYSVVTVRISSNNYDFLKYAFDAISNESTKMGLSSSEFLPRENKQENMQEAILVLFPANQRSIASLKDIGEGLRQAASVRSNKSTSCKVFVSSEPFMMVAESSPNA